MALTATRPGVATARALARPEVDLRAGAVAVALRVAAGDSDTLSRMSLLIIASEPVSLALRTVWTSSGLGTPSSVTPTWRKSLPRTEKSLRKSSLPPTPGSVCTARIGSSASRLRRF